MEARINPPSQMPLDKAGKNGKVNDLTADSAPVFGTTAPANLLPRERFKYWCFDLLFLTCSASTQGILNLNTWSAITDGRPGSDNATERQRIAALILPSLLSRCHTVLATYVVDEALRGGVPFPRWASVSESSHVIDIFTQGEGGGTSLRPSQASGTPSLVRLFMGFFLG